MAASTRPGPRSRPGGSATSHPPQVARRDLAARDHHDRPATAPPRPIPLQLVVRCAGRTGKQWQAAPTSTPTSTTTARTGLMAGTHTTRRSSPGAEESAAHSRAPGTAAWNPTYGQPPGRKRGLKQPLRPRDPVPSHPAPTSSKLLRAPRPGGNGHPPRNGRIFPDRPGRDHPGLGLQWRRGAEGPASGPLTPRSTGRPLGRRSYDPAPTQAVVRLWLKLRGGGGADRGPPRPRRGTGVAAPAEEVSTNPSGREYGRPAGADRSGPGWATPQGVDVFIC